MSSSRLFLIDGHALCYRSFYAIRELSTSTGQATNAVYGFVSTLRKILRVYKPEYMAVCFDFGKKTFRQEKFAEYKIQRPKMPEDLRSQILIIKDVIKAFHVPIFEREGYEADDIIATLTDQVSDNVEVVIVTEDKDMYQLINNHTRFFSIRKDTIAGYEDIKEKLGFEPNRIIDFIGLAGDSSDNIPGIAGIGEVTARKLINQYSSLEDIFDHLDEITPVKVREKLSQQKESAVLSKELAILYREVPLDFELEKAKVQEPNNDRLVEMFKFLEFQRLAEEYGKQALAHTEAIQIKKCETPEEIQNLIKHIEKNTRVAFFIDTENAQEMFFSLGQHSVFSVPSAKIGDLKVIFENEKILKIVYSLKNMLKVLGQQNCTIKGDVFDIMLAGYLLKPAQASFALSGLVWEFFKESLPEDSKSANAAYQLLRLYPLLLKELQDKLLIRLFEEIEMPLSEVLFKMEKEGVCLDTDLLLELSKECDLKIQQLTEQIYKQAGEKFNLNSPKQLSHILFEKLKLPVVKKTKTGFSTNEEVLLKLAKKHDVPVLILDYRQLAKLKSTYIDAFPQLINSETGRIHTEFLQTGTETGRLSSRHPNLQNIPVRTGLGRQVRKAIIPSKGNILIAADYSQIELRILAHLSGDENLIKAFQSNQDIHRYTASLMFEVDEKDVTSEMRNSAKRINFGIVYGMGAFSLSKDLQISQREAQEFIDRYFLRYPKVREFMDNEIRKCEEKGYVLTLLNRRRYIPEINNRNGSVQQFAQRQAINTPVQGTAADLMKLAMINVQKEIEKRKLKSRMTITVHDELVFDASFKEKEDVFGLIYELMENPIKLSVPVTVSIKAGKNWMEMKKI